MRNRRYWKGPTLLAWGAGSVAELGQAVDGELKLPKNLPMYKDKVQIKGAIADGLEIPFDAALKMPTHPRLSGPFSRRCSARRRPSSADWLALAARWPDRFRRS